MQSRMLLSVSLLVILVAAIFCEGCGGSKNSGQSSVPAIQNINSSTTPTSPANLPIEINGSGFQAAPWQGDVHAGKHLR